MEPTTLTGYYLRLSDNVSRNTETGEEVARHPRFIMATHSLVPGIPSPYFSSEGEALFVYQQTCKAAGTQPQPVTVLEVKLEVREIP